MLLTLVGLDCHAPGQDIVAMGTIHLGRILLYMYKHDHACDMYYYFIRLKLTLQACMSVIPSKIRGSTPQRAVDKLWLAQTIDYKAKDLTVIVCPSHLPSKNPGSAPRCTLDSDSAEFGYMTAAIGNSIDYCIAQLWLAPINAYCHRCVYIKFNIIGKFLIW